MEYLSKIFNISSNNEHSMVYERRFYADSSVVFPLKIKPMKQSNEFQLYFLPTVKTMALFTEVYKLDSEINRVYNDLPNVAKQDFINDCLAEELFNSNDLEGVISTKQEIVRSAKESFGNEKSKSRFLSMINSYRRIVFGESKPLRDVKEVREIYNYLVLDELDEKNFPDGKVFRKDHTSVLKQSGTQKEIHRGVYPEEKIISHISSMIEFLDDERFLPLIRIAVAHYYFGYIHPFYDGNGRTSRYLSSIYLDKVFGKLTAISLSRGCNRNTRKYLEAFEKTNSISNRGEMNFFIDSFVEIIIESQQTMLSELKEKIKLLEFLQYKINSELLLENASEDYRKVLFILGQNLYFSSEKGMHLKELSRYVEKSEQTVRKVLGDLIEFKIVTSSGKRPIIYTISDEYFE